MFRGSLASKAALAFAALIILTVALQTEAFRTLVGFWKGSDGPCPDNYVLVPAKTFVSYDFCVAKYEMKNVDGFALPVADEDVWTDVTRSEAAALCRANGPNFDLINNSEWQTIARNIADVPANWSSGTVGTGQLNVGHSDNVPVGPLVADTNDNAACSGTGQTCSSSVWHAQRRTMVLSNGNVIWDFAGNSAEWVSDSNSVSPGAAGYASTFTAGDTRQTYFGNDTACTGSGATPWCGFGYGGTAGSAGGMIRGGASEDGLAAGVFAVDLGYAGTMKSDWVGFRCVRRPMTVVESCAGAPVGTACNGGPKYAGVLSTVDYMVTPSGCTNSVTPDCSGGADTIAMRYGANLTHGTGSDTDGQGNTILLENVSFAAPIAARYCSAMVYGGYDDWFLPGKDELNLLATNRVAIGGFSNANYWASTQYLTSNAYVQNLGTGAAATNIAKTTTTPLIRCVRKMIPALSAWEPEIFHLDVVYPSTTSAWKTVTITNTGQKATVALTTSATTGYSIGSDGCVGQTLAIGASCTLQVRASGANLDGPKTGTLTVASGTVNVVVPLSGTVSGFPDPCLTTSTMGTLCEGGPLYAGTFTYGADNRKLMVTPGGCTNSTTPDCAGGTDTVTKTWGANSITTNQTSLTNGNTNTATLASGWSDTLAAKFCADMVYGGYDDWHLPAENELNQLYTNRVAIGGFSGRYWSSTEGTTLATQARDKNFSSGSVASSAKTTAYAVRCVRRYAGLESSPTVISDLNIVAPSVNSNWKLITVSNTGGTTTGSLTTSITGSLLEIDAATNTCQGASLASGATCSYRIRAANATVDDTISGSTTVTTGSLSATTTISGTITGVGDPCSAVSPAIGVTCWGGARYSGLVLGTATMITPGNCTDSATPTCSGGTDTLTKAYNTASTTEMTPKSTTDGVGNTLILAGKATADAGKYCANMVFGGYDDWYLPASDELNALYAGGGTGAMGGFANADYWSSTETTAVFFMWQSRRQNMSTGAAGETVSTTAKLVRCIRMAVDHVPNPVDWTDFSMTSNIQTINSISSISMEMSYTVGAGTPKVYYRKNGTGWVLMAPGSPVTMTVTNQTSFQFMVGGTSGASATISVKNISDSNSILDTVTGSSPAACDGSWAGGYCWYRSGSGQNCTDACATHGGYHSATRTYVGDQGTNANCGAVLAGLGSPDLGAAVSSSSCEDGYQNAGCYIQMLSGNWRCTNGATSAGFATSDRACACNN